MAPEGETGRIGAGRTNAGPIRTGARVAYHPQGVRLDGHLLRGGAATRTVDHCTSPPFVPGNRTRTRLQAQERPGCTPREAEACFPVGKRARNGPFRGPLARLDAEACFPVCKRASNGIRRGRTGCLDPDLQSASRQRAPSGLRRGPTGCLDPDLQSASRHMAPNGIRRGPTGCPDPDLQSASRQQGRASSARTHHGSRRPSGGDPPARLERGRVGPEHLERPIERRIVARCEVVRDRDQNVGLETHIVDPALVQRQPARDGQAERSALPGQLLPLLDGAP